MPSRVGRKPVFAAGLAALVAGVLAIGLLASNTGPHRPDVESDPRAAADVQAGAIERRGPSRPERPASVSEEAEDLIAHLRERFGPTIDHPSTRMAVIEKLMAYLQRAHPEDWRERIAELLAKAFPERAGELADLLEKRLRYAELLQERRADYESLDPRDRRDAIWAERDRVFGDEADAIWASARRAEQIQLALEDIDEGVAGADLGAQLDRYVSAIEEAYGDRASELISGRQSELVNHFLQVDSVQEELRALEPGERSRSLRQIRDALGMNEAALARWDDLDDRRDRMWARGLEYEQERRRLLESARGASAEAPIRDLQDRVFGSAADTIRAEEASGFYRFARPRRIGRE